MSSMYITHEPGKTGAMHAYLESMEVPRPFGTARIILAHGAVGWFMNLIVGIGIIGLLAASVASAAAGTGGSAGASMFLLLLLGFALYRLVIRLSVPFREAAALRKGRLVRCAIVDRTAKTKIFSRMGSKRRTIYTIRPEGGAAASAMSVVFEDMNVYPGEECIAVIDERDKKIGSVLALDCFLHHRSLSFPDLLEKEEQETARRNLGYDDQWQSALGKTFPSLAGRLGMTLIILGAVGGAIVFLLRMYG